MLKMLKLEAVAELLIESLIGASVLSGINQMISDESSFRDESFLMKYCSISRGERMKNMCQ